MKVIDLLNKIANGEEVPKRIKYDEYEYEWCLGLLDYTHKSKQNIISLFDEYICNLCNDLNDEVEILEDTTKEEKKIPEKIPLNYADDRKPEEVYEYLRCSYNQLIDYLKSKGE